jgi:hypothetical protein
LSFESFHIALVREMFTPRQSTVNETMREIRHSIPMMLCGLLSNLLWGTQLLSLSRLRDVQRSQSSQKGDVGLEFCCKFKSRIQVLLYARSWIENVRPGLTFECKTRYRVLHFQFSLQNLVFSRKPKPTENNRKWVW